MLLGLNVLFKLLLLILKLLIEHLSHFIYFLEDIDASSLTWSLGLAYENYTWLRLRWFRWLRARCRIHRKYRCWSLFVFRQKLIQLLLIVLIDVVEICWVQPCHWEKVVVTLPWKLLFKSSQMYTESVLSRYIVHAEEVIDSLPWKQSAQPFGCEASIVEPVDIPCAHFISLPKIVTFCWWTSRLYIIFIVISCLIAILLLNYCDYWTLISWKQSFPLKYFMGDLSEDVISAF